MKEKAERDKQRAAEAAERAAAKAAAEAEKIRLREEAAAAKAAAKAAAEAEKARLKAEAEAKKKAEAKKFIIVKGPSEDGITSTKEFDLKFLFAQRDALRIERAKLLGQADRLEDEANALIADAEMGDVQFDDEGGEGDTMVVERERDQVLSAQARQTVSEIDAAIERMSRGEYGYSVVSGFPIPKERLKALPWATELVTERAGGLGRR
jgi:RNA polymerase-binding transcription factor DksA